MQVLSRACFLLHCAHTVHECNRGNWPAWMKAQVFDIRYIKYYDFSLNPPPQLKIAEKSQAPSSRDMRSGRHPSIVPGAPKGLDADGDADDYLQKDF